MANRAAMGDTPQISSAMYASSSTMLGELAAQNSASPGWGATALNNFQQDLYEAREKEVLRQRSLDVDRGKHVRAQLHQQKQEEKKQMANPRRLVQVLIADPDENVPLEECLLYKGDPKLTDSTDTELYFEIDIKNLLDEHNKKRITYHDKKVKERTEHLEPARVRDLKMVVVTLATF